jgi:hypothetical protein
MFIPERAFQKATMAGLLTYSFRNRLPIRQLAGSGQIVPKTYGAYSSGYCTGFTPVSLFSLGSADS